METPRDRQTENPLGYLVSRDGENGERWPVISEEIKSWAALSRCSRGQAFFMRSEYVSRMRLPDLFLVCVVCGQSLS